MPDAGDITVKLEDEVVISGSPATVYVYQGDKLVAQVTADTELQRGADGGLYYAVVLKRET